MRAAIAAVIEVASGAAIVYGAALAYPPAGWMLGGAGGLLYAFVLDARSEKKESPST